MRLPPALTGDSAFADRSHRRAKLLDQLVFQFQLLERHLLFPDLRRNVVFKLKDVIALQPQCNAAQRTGVTGVSLLERSGQDFQVGSLIQAKNEKEIIRSVLFGKFLDRFLIRKTCGTGCGSHVARRRFIDDMSTGRFDTLANRQTSHIVALTKHRDLLSLQLHSILSL